MIYIKVHNDHRSKFSNLSNWKEEAWKNQGFNGIRTRDLRDTDAMLYQLSYEATHWERGQFVEFISPVRSEMAWSHDIWNNRYVKANVNCGGRSKWRMIIAVNFPIKQLERRMMMIYIIIDKKFYISDFNNFTY